MHARLILEVAGAQRAAQKSGAEDLAVQEALRIAPLWSTAA
jgi:hypothetical protein